MPSSAGPRGGSSASTHSVISAEPGSQSPSSGRLRELDSLRGLAALTVVLTHFHDLWFDRIAPHFSNIWIGRLHTALIPLYSGHQAVMLFFLLSGFVLSLPFEHGKPQPYSVFLLRRLTRIYLPYLGALALAILGAFLLHGNLHHGAWPAHTWDERPQLGTILRHIAFVDSIDPRPLNPPVWSLVHEMRISLVFPFLWLLTRRLSTRAALLLPILFTATAAFFTRGPALDVHITVAVTLHYTGFFVIGILLARHHRTLLPRRPSAIAALTAVSVILYFYGMLLAQKLGTTRLSPAPSLMVSEYFVLVGATGLILSAIAAPRPLLHPIPIFAGRISYSLYLLHFPVLLTVTFLAVSLPIAVQCLLYLACSLALATVYCRFVEEPLTRWGRRITSKKAA